MVNCIFLRGEHNFSFPKIWSKVEKQKLASVQTIQEKWEEGHFLIERRNSPVSEYLATKQVSRQEPRPRKLIPSCGFLLALLRYNKAKWAWGQRYFQVRSNETDEGPGGSVVKNSPVTAGDTGSIPLSGRPLGGGNGNPPQYSCWENPTGVTKSRTWLSIHIHTHTHLPQVLKIKATLSPIININLTQSWVITRTIALVSFLK